ncbi:PA14 domain-containing protein, partial [Streptomyces globisporus]
MHPRPLHRCRRHLTGLLVSAFLVGAFAASPATAAPAPRPQDELPPQEPGVTLRVFDVQVPLEKLCDIKAGQTPNVDKLMPGVDWSSADDFGFSDHFVSQVTANLTVPEDGTYDFRLISDDGSRLRI